MSQPRILIITPFRNEFHSIPFYLTALLSLDYPHELIDLYWLENDSTDRTLRLLKQVRGNLHFHHHEFRSKRIIGRVRKRTPGNYWKDLRYGRGRVRAWLIIWNQYFLPLIRKSRVDYVLLWYADAIPPSNVITEYLKVFKNHKDAGWVGGAMYRRYPRQKQVLSPWPTKAIHARKPVKVELTGHVALIRRAALARCTLYYVAREMGYSLSRCLQKRGFYVYYQPSVFIKHVSTDGRIHDHKLRR